MFFKSETECLYVQKIQYEYIYSHRTAQQFVNKKAVKQLRDVASMEIIPYL